MRPRSSFAPGEVIFFGEHSVVYGHEAVAAAIDRGIRVHFSPRKEGLEIISRLGRLKADIKGFRLANIKGADQLKPLIPGIQRLFQKYRRAIPGQLKIDSQIPEQSGLASSAAVSSAMVVLILNLLNQKANARQRVKWVYESEIDIQKRGSVIGSACTMNGGVVGVQKGVWKSLAMPERAFKMLVIDSKQRCSTAKTTAIVKKDLERDPEGSRKIFDQMHRIARKGRQALLKGDAKALGALMLDNQRYLKKLKVSTAKIDRVIQAIRPYVWGVKITGAGGGGCLVCLPKAPLKKFAPILKREGCDFWTTQLNRRGAYAKDR